jgi:hypothetical protein
METQEELRTTAERRLEPAGPAGNADLGPSAGRAPATPCPERIWWFGVFVGGITMLIGSMLILTVFGAPLGIPLWAAGLGLMLSRRPCPD